MVDFNNETTIGTPALDIVRVLVLQRRADLIEAWEEYKKKDYKGTYSDLAVVRARLFSLFLECQAMLKRRLKTKDYEDLLNKIESDDPKVIRYFIFKFNEELDNIRLTRLDTKKSYDRTKWEEENKASGI